MKAEKPANPFLLTLLTVSLLAVLALFKPDFTLGGLELRPVNLLSDVLRPPAQRLRRAPGSLAPRSQPRSAADSALFATQAGLASFLQALHQTKATGRKIRIAYFGDSMIEGDLITGDLRQALQSTFGGEGVGFVPITSVTAGFRTTIYQSFSDNWHQYDLRSASLPKAYPLGLSGQVFVAPAVRAGADSGAAPGAAWTHFTAGRPYPTVRQLTRARLLYGPGNAQDQVAVRFGSHRSVMALAGTAPLNEVTLTASPAAQKLWLSFNCRAPRSIYGVSFEGPQGVTLDNFSFRGSSGLSLRRIPPAMLAAFGQQQHYDLLILHYGANVVTSRLKNYANYTRALERVIDRLQAACPHASILLVGMSDKSYRWQGEFVTDPSVPLLLAAQQQLAARKHLAFWNLFEAMGGENSMVRWVEDPPSLANRDYTHVNARGAQKIAGLLYQFLLQQSQLPIAQLVAQTSGQSQRTSQRSATR